MNQAEINNLRKAVGTLPSEKPEKSTNIVEFESSINVELVDHSKNPIKALFLMATATWGDNNYNNKWNIVTNQGKLEVIKAVLTHNTLPQAREVVNFLFKVRGVPRWLFDYHTQVPFTTFASIGCRDNNKLDSDIVMTDPTHHSKMQSAADTYEDLKNLYETVINSGNGSWQSARAFLPQSYSHSYFFSQNLLSIASMKYDLSDYNSCMLYRIYSYISNEIHKKVSPLLAQYLVSTRNTSIFNDFCKYISSVNDIQQLNSADIKLFEEQ